MNKSDVISKTMIFFKNRKTLLNGEFRKDGCDIKISNSNFDDLLTRLGFCRINPVIFYNINELSEDDLLVTIQHSNITITLASYYDEYGKYVGQVSSAEFHVVMEDGRKVYAEYIPEWKKELDKLIKR